MVPLRTFASAAASLLLGCGGTAPPAASPQPVPTEWRATLAEHVALWYHSLALTAAASDDLGQPTHAAAYADRAAEARRARDIPPTPLVAAADEFNRRFDAEPAYHALHYLPLYFGDTDALFAGIRYWLQVGGEARRAEDQVAADMVARLSTWFPRTAHRRLLAEWLEVLEQEYSLFFRDYWQTELPRLETTAEDVQTRWRSLASAVDRYLRYVRLSRGELFLVPALGSDGRLISDGVAVPRVAVGISHADGAPGVIWTFVRELLNPLAVEAITEYLAPAHIRELGRERLVARTTVRGGALLLERTAPGYADEYRAYFLRNAERPVAELVSTGDLAADFELAFPLPPELESGLARHVAAALAGI